MQETAEGSKEIDLTPTITSLHGPTCACISHPKDRERQLECPGETLYLYYVIAVHVVIILDMTIYSSL